MLQSHTKITTLHKVKAHANINGNEQADTLATLGCKLDHRDAPTTRTCTPYTILPPK